MSFWAFIALIAIASMVFDYLKTKNKTNDAISKKSEQLNSVKEELSDLRNRIENLEAIAVSEPDDFTENFEPTLEDFDETDENRDQVSAMAKRRRKTR